MAYFGDFTWNKAIHCLFLSVRDIWSKSLFFNSCAQLQGNGQWFSHSPFEERRKQKRSESKTQCTKWTVWIPEKQKVLTVNKKLYLRYFLSDTRSIKPVTAKQYQIFVKYSSPRNMATKKVTPSAFHIKSNKSSTPLVSIWWVFLLRNRKFLYPEFSKKLLQTVE